VAVVQEAEEEEKTFSLPLNTKKQNTEMKVNKKRMPLISIHTSTIV
jgi:hypothetical protein